MVSTAVCFRATVTTHLEVTLFRRLVATPTHSAVLVFLQQTLRLGFSRTLFARQEFLAGGARGAVVAKQREDLLTNLANQRKSTRQFLHTWPNIAGIQQNLVRLGREVCVGVDDGHRDYAVLRGQLRHELLCAFQDRAHPFQIVVFTMRSIDTLRSSFTIFCFFWRATLCFSAARLRFSCLALFYACTLPSQAQILFA